MTEAVSPNKPHFWRNYNAINMTDLVNDLKSFNLDRIYQLTEVDDMIECLNGVIVDLLNNHAPLQPFCRRPGINSTKSWYSKEIDIAAANRDLAKQAYKADKTSENRKSYHKLRNIANHNVAS